MKYLIGIDSGGSKTETVLFDDRGHVLVRDLDAGANAMDIGVEPALEIVTRVLDRVISQSPGEVAEVFGGMVATSLGDFMVRHMRTILPKGTNAHVIADGGVLISGMIGHRDGCGMVAGTGASMFVRRGEDPLIKIGGRGYLLDADGSGYGLGRDALCYAFRDYDRRYKKTVIKDFVEDQLGKPIQDATADIYGNPKESRAFIAKFAHIIFKARDIGDEVASELFEMHTDALANMTYSAERFFDGRFPVVMSGGIFQNFPEYADAVIKKSSKKAEMILSNVPPIYGSAVEAMWHAGLSIEDDFKDTFLASYKKIKSNA